MTGNSELNKNMGAMETSISDLQDELVVANEPSRKRFRFGGFMLAFMVAVVVGGATFVSTDKLHRVDANTTIIAKLCSVQNNRTKVVNEKFAQLVTVLNYAIEHPDAEAARLYGLFREPIKELECP